jgi:hypothetical protein
MVILRAKRGVNHLPGFLGRKESTSAPAPPGEVLLADQGVLDGQVLAECHVGGSRKPIHEIGIIGFHDMATSAALSASHALHG